MSGDTIVRDAAWAREQLNDLRHGLTLTVDKINTIFEAEAWTLLGYETFDKMWIGEDLPDVTFPRELHAHFAYKMFDEGATPVDVATNIKWVGEEKAENLLQEKLNDVPAGAATGEKPKRRDRTKLTETLFVHIPIAKWDMWRARCLRNSTTIHELALDVLEKAVNELPKP